MPLDDRFISELLQIDIPDRSSAKGWRLKRSAIKDACDELNITMPLVVRHRFFPIDSRGVTSLGTHKCVAPGKHAIWLNEGLPPKEVSWVLWHELAHAMQVERAVAIAGVSPERFYREVYLQAQGGLGIEYIGNDYEIEARNIAETNSHKELIYPYDAYDRETDRLERST